MGLFDYRRGDERAFLDSGFEPHGDLYLFYRHHWARGIPVSAEERETYLRGPLGGSRRAFYAAIAGRPATGPRRSWWRSQRATLAAIPVGFGFGLVLLGAMLLWRGGGFEDASLRWLLAIAGAMAVAYGALVLAVRVRRGAGPNSSPTDIHP